MQTKRPFNDPKWIRTARGFVLEISAIGRVEVEIGGHTTLTVAHGADAARVSAETDGIIFALTQHARGLLVLHGSAVSVEDQAFGFLGCSGMGKSTLGLALKARGHTLVTDDVLAVDLRSSPPLALPGFAWANLWPDAADCLQENLADLPRLHSATEKRRLVVTVSDAPVALSRLFSLRRGDSLSLTPLEGAAALISTAGHAYLARFAAMQDPARQLRQCTELARNVQMFELTVPNGLEHIDATLDLIEAM